MKIKTINEKFILSKSDIEKLHPLDYLKLIKNICTFLEKEIKTLKQDCLTPFKWQYYKQEILMDWGKWSHGANKILRQRIKDTNNDKNQKLNKQYNYAYQYWWQSNFYLEIVALFIHPISQKKAKSVYLNNRKELEKIIKTIK